MRRNRRTITQEPQGPWTPPTFREATDIEDVVRLRRSLRRRMIAMRVLTVVLITAAVVVGATPFVLQWNTARVASHMSHDADPLHRNRTYERPISILCRRGRNSG